MPSPLHVSFLGGGNWGSASAKVAAENCALLHQFHDEVKMFVLREIVNGCTLADVINKHHENVKYLPSITLPDNLIATEDMNECIRDADILVFVVPHQYLKSTCEVIKKSGLVKPSAIAISLVKGIQLTDSKPVLLTKLIHDEIGIPCCALSGANVAISVARCEFSEATIGYDTLEHAIIFQQLFHRPYFQIRCVKGVAGVQVYGALKNVVALAAGFCDGLGLGSNTKSATMRIGLLEISKFIKLFFDKDEGADVPFESAGIADLITTCISGRNVQCAAEFAKHNGNKSWEEIESQLLNGQKLQGTSTCLEVYKVLQAHDLLKSFPLFESTFLISFNKLHPMTLIKRFE